jgi:Trypsin-like peptidase domain
VNPLLKVTTSCLFFAPLFNYICLYAFPPHDIDVDEKGRWEKTYRNVQQFVGRVFFHEVCQGSFALLVWLKKLYIITCRHVVFDEDMGGIPIFCLSFVIQNMSFSAKEGNLKYVGSTNSELDLSFFEVQNEAVKGFHLDVNHDVYQGQSITIAGFPSGLEELEGELEKEPKVRSGRVAAAGSVNKVAFSDISGSLPNTSGAAMISTMDFGRTLYGIHGGAVYYEDTVNKLKYENEKTTRIRQKDIYNLVNDKTLAEAPNLPNVKELYDSPEGNVRSRGLHASDNMKHKGAMTFFMTNSTIASFLMANEIEFGMLGETETLLDTVVLCAVATESRRERSKK